jgi:hypothetical protein
MSRKPQVRRWSLAVALSAALAFTLPSSSQASDQVDEWYPGLPNQTFGNWASTSSGGMTYAKRAKQWFIAPAGMATSEAINLPNADDPTGVSQFLRAKTYFVSPTGAPANYGYLEPMTVRSVGFGLMPVEATVQVSQRRANGYPVPFHVVLLNSGMSANPYRYYYGPAQVADAVNVRILSVKIDGVDVGITGNCRTATPAPLNLASPGYTVTNQDEGAWFAAQDPSTYFHPSYGGELRGTITIPPFKGCTTKTGDDMSKLMTLAASGPGNPIVARAGSPCGLTVNGVNAPPAPGQSTPKKTGCHGPKAFKYPDRPAD